MPDLQKRIIDLTEITDITEDMYMMLDQSSVGTRKYNLKRMYDKVDSSSSAATSAANAANAATAQAIEARDSASEATAAAVALIADSATQLETALDAIGDISEQAVPLMSPTTRGGAKLGHGLAIEDGALTLGKVTNPTDAGPIVELTAKGWAEQDTTVGKNLLTLSDNTRTNKGTTATISDNTRVVISGTSTSSSAYVVSNTLTITQLFTAGQTYTISLTGAITNGYVQLNCTPEGESTRSLAKTSGNSVTFTVPSNVERVSFFVGVSGAGAASADVRMQIELGSTATSYEPYSGGAPSPSPSYPQEIRRVTGHTIAGKTGRFVDVDVQGRNLLPYASVDLTTNRTATLWNNNREELPAGTYTVSITPLDITPLLQLMYTDGTNKSFTIGLSGVLTLEAEKPFDRIYWYISNTDWNNGKRVVLENIMFEKGSVAHPYEPYYHATIPVPLPERGWVAALPDGTCDTLTLDGAGGYVWELRTRMTTQAVTDGVTGTVGVNVMSSTGQIADGATVLYKGATTTERGYVDSMPTVPVHASISSTDLHDLTVRCCADEGAAEIASAWGRRYESRIANLESAVATLVAAGA